MQPESICIYNCIRNPQQYLKCALYTKDIILLLTSFWRQFEFRVRKSPQVPRTLLSILLNSNRSWGQDDLYRSDIQFP